MAVFAAVNVCEASCDELISRLDRFATAGHELKQSSRLTADTWSAPVLSGFVECRYSEDDGDYSCTGRFSTSQASVETEVREYAEFFRTCTPMGWRGFSKDSAFEWNDKLGMQYSVNVMPTLKLIDGRLQTGYQSIFTVSKHASSDEGKNFQFAERALTCELVEALANDGLTAQKGANIAPDRWASKIGLRGAEHCEIMEGTDDGGESANVLNCESSPYRDKSDAQQAYAAMVAILQSCSDDSSTNDVTLIASEPRVAIRVSDDAAALVVLQTTIALRWTFSLAFF